MSSYLSTLVIRAHRPAFAVRPVLLPRFSPVRVDGVYGGWRNRGRAPTDDAEAAGAFAGETPFEGALAGSDPASAREIQPHARGGGDRDAAWAGELDPARPAALTASRGHGQGMPPAAALALEPGAEPAGHALYPATRALAAAGGAPSFEAPASPTAPPAPYVLSVFPEVPAAVQRVPALDAARVTAARPQSQIAARLPGVHAAETSTTARSQAEQHEFLPTVSSPVLRPASPVPSVGLAALDARAGRARGDGLATHADTAPHTVHVTIGRLEVRVAPQPAARSTQRAAAPAPSLDDYVRARNGGGAR